jgi:hypothetical protein
MSRGADVNGYWAGLLQALEAACRTTTLLIEWGSEIIYNTAKLSWERQYAQVDFRRLLLISSSLNPTRDA